MLKKGESHQHCVVFECERAHENGNLISCCRYRLTDKFRESTDSNCIFVLLIHLPKKCLKSNFVSFQGRPWLCYHVDAIFPTDNSVPLAEILFGETHALSDIYYNDKEMSVSYHSADKDDGDDGVMVHYNLLSYSEPRRTNLCQRMYLHISKAASDQDQVKRLTELIPQRVTFPLIGKH